MTPNPRKPRNLTLLWTMVAFVLLTIGCLAAVAILASGGRLPELGNGQSWTPPPEQPAAAPISTAPSASGLRFQPGDSVLNVNAGPVNLRQSPGFQNKPAGDVIVAVPAREVGVIVAGPVEADGLTWWQVRFGERTGWMAERSSSGVALLDRAR